MGATPKADFESRFGEGRRGMRNRPPQDRPYPRDICLPALRALPLPVKAESKSE